MKFHPVAAPVDGQADGDVTAQQPLVLERHHHGPLPHQVSGRTDEGLRRIDSHGEIAARAHFKGEPSYSPARIQSDAGLGLHQPGPSAVSLRGMFISDKLPELAPQIGRNHLVGLIFISGPLAVGGIGIEQGHAFDDGKPGATLRAIEGTGFDVAVTLPADVGNERVFARQAAGADDQIKKVLFHIILDICGLGCLIFLFMSLCPDNDGNEMRWNCRSVEHLWWPT